MKRGSERVVAGGGWVGALLGGKEEKQGATNQLCILLAQWHCQLHVEQRLFVRLRLPGLAGVITPELPLI